MEHRHDRQHRVALAQPERVGLVGEQRVEHRRAVRVDDPLRAFRSCRSCNTSPRPSSRRGRGTRTPGRRRRSTPRSRARPRGSQSSVGHQHFVLDALEARHPLGQRCVEEDHAVLGVARRCSEGPPRTGGCSGCAAPPPSTGRPSTARGAGGSSSRTSRPGRPAGSQAASARSRAAARARRPRRNSNVRRPSAVTLTISRSANSCPARSAIERTSSGVRIISPSSAVVGA